VGVKFGLVWMGLVGVCFSIGHFKFVLWQAGFFSFIGFATIALACYTSLFLKLVSYVSVNRWCREEKIVKRLKGINGKKLLALLQTLWFFKSFKLDIFILRFKRGGYRPCESCDFTRSNFT